jgi:hypothetical protein
MPPRKKGKGKRQGAASNYGDRNWKSQNFPANYNSDQAVPVLHDASSSPAKEGWWADSELGFAIMDNAAPMPLHTSLLHDYVQHNTLGIGSWGGSKAGYLDLLQSVLEEISKLVF